MPDCVNRVFLIGRVGQEPELKKFDSGESVLEVRMVTNETWKGRDGEKQESSTWHTVKIWGKRGEALARLINKGEMLHVQGAIDERSWDDKSGNKRYKTEIKVGPRGEVALLGGSPRGEQQQATKKPGGGFGDDDIPFMRLDERCY